MSNERKGKVSRAEELLYGQYAYPLREISVALVAAEAARDAVGELLHESSEADAMTAGPRNDQGQSPHTEWLAGWFDRVHGQFSEQRGLYADAAKDFQERWKMFMDGDS